MIITDEAVQAFLSGHRIAVVGASDERSNFGGAVYRAFRDHGYEVFAVHPSAPAVAGDRCYPDVASLPPPIDGAVVMVAAAASPAVVEACADAGIPRVWLFKGIGGEGALSDAAVLAAQERGLDVVPGACPLMFLGPVGWFHRIHRAARRRRGALAA
jgi:predicted CoA-binding protein